MRFKETANTAMGFSEEGNERERNWKGACEKDCGACSCEILPNIAFGAIPVRADRGLPPSKSDVTRRAQTTVLILKARFLLYTARTTRELGVQHTVEASYKSAKYTCPQFKEQARSP